MAGKLLLQAAAALSILTPTVCAAATEIAVDCGRLDAARADELVARMRLALRAGKNQPRTLQLVCVEGHATLVWDGPPTEKIPVDEQPGLVEGTLDALEVRLAKPAEQAPQTAPPEKEAPISPLEVPPGLGPKRSPAPTTRAERAETARRTAVGGVDLALAFELLPSPLDAAIGPRLDVGVGSHDWAVILGETGRLATGGSFHALLFDLQVGAAWGAPYALDKRLGATLLVGWQWLSAWREGLPDSSHTDSSGTLAFGLRTSFDGSWFVPWVGIDGVWRFTPPEIGDPFPSRTSAFSAVLSLGVVLADRSAR